MNPNPITLKIWIRSVVFVLIVSLAIPLQAFSKDGKNGKDDPSVGYSDFKIQNMALRSMNETAQSGSTISANHSAPYFEAKYAADGKPTTAWCDFLYYRSSDYLMVDFGEEIMVSRVMIQNFVDMSAGMAAFDLQYTKGSSWSTFGRFTTAVVNGEKIEIELPEIKASAIRITNFSIDSGKNCVAVSEFEVNTPQMKSSINTAENPATNANDGLRNTAWTNCFFASGSDFLEIDLGRVAIVNLVQIINVVNETTGVSQFDLEYNNGISWQKIGQYGTNLTDGEVIKISLPDIYTKSLRIKNFALGTGKTCAGIAEFQVNPPTMSSTAPKEASHPAFDAGDEDTASYWLNCDDLEETGALKIDLGIPVDISRITVTNNFPETGDTGMLEFDIEYLENGEWIQAGDRQKGAVSHQSFFNVKLTTPVYAQEFRLVNFTMASGRTCVGVGDVSFFMPERLPYVAMPTIIVETLPELISISLAPEETGADNSEDREIVLTGLNFIGEPDADTIYFENAEGLPFNIKNTGGTDTELYATIPEGTPEGLYDVYVVNEFGTSNILAEGWEITKVVVKREDNPSSNSDTFGFCFISSAGSVSVNGLEGAILLIGALVSILLFLKGKEDSTR